MTTKAREPDPVQPPPAQPEPTRTPKSSQPAEGMCAVNDGSPHYADGRAIPGTAVCSAHEIHFFRDGSPRANPDGSRREGP